MYKLFFIKQYHKIVLDNTNDWLNAFWVWTSLGILKLILLNKVFRVLTIRRFNLLCICIKQEQNAYNFFFRRYFKGIFFGYFEKLKLLGLGHKIFIKKWFIYFKFDYSHLIYFRIPQLLSIVISGRKLKQLHFFSVFQNSIRNISRKIYCFYRPDPYKRRYPKGFLFPATPEVKKKQQKLVY